MRDSVLFYRSFWEAIKHLPEADQLDAIKAILEYGLDGKEPEATGAALAIFMMARPQIDANNRRYQNGTKGGRPPKHTTEETEEARKARQSQKYFEWRDSVYERDNYSCMMCGETEGLEAHHKKDFIEYPELRYEIANGITLCGKCHKLIHNSGNQKKPSGNQKEPNCESEKPKEKEKEKVKVKEKDKEKESKRFAPPTLENVIGYCQESGYQVDAQRFIDFYTSKGWMVGKNPMRDWKAAVRNWARQGKEEKPAPVRLTQKKNQFHNFDQRDYDFDDLMKQVREAEG